MQYSTIQYGAVRCSEVQLGAVRCGAESGVQRFYRLYTVNCRTIAHLPAVTHHDYLQTATAMLGGKVWGGG